MENNRNDYRKSVKQMGKKEFTLMKMQEYGFWPSNLPTPYERQKSETQEDYDARKALINEYEKLAGEIANLYKDEQEINKQIKSLTQQLGDTWDYEKIRKDVSQQIMKESIKRRAERKQQRELEKKQKSEAWQRNKQDNIVFIGKGYSGGLCHKQTDSGKLAVHGLPLIEDDKQLAVFLGLEYKDLRFLAYHRDVVTVDHYHRYTVPKKSGGERKISAPKPMLKNVQRKILCDILEKIEVSDSAHGFIKQKSVVTGAREHEPSPAIVINMDVTDFFPTITFNRVRGLFQSFGYSGYVSSLLAMVCTDCNRTEIEVRGQKKYVKTSERVLPQGSPASPMITNILCRSMDKQINTKALEYKFSYSRYADDISISFVDMPSDQQMKESVYHVMTSVENQGFRINHKKTRYLRENNRQVITGVVINHHEAGVPKDWVKRLRAMIHKASIMKQSGNIPKDLSNKILGMCAWLSSVNPERYSKIIQSAKNVLE